jgi:hypothetical protein
MEAGLTLDDAAKCVEVALREGGMQLGRPTTAPGKTVLNWRKECREGSLDSPWVREYRSQINTGHCQGHLEGEALIAAIRKALRAVASSFR